MTSEPRTQHDYGQRDVEAAWRVLVDLGQVLGSWFADSIVVVGGWVPDLLLPNTEEPHVGSIDVDLALDADKLRGGRYAEIVRSRPGGTRRLTSSTSFVRQWTSMMAGQRSLLRSISSKPQRDGEAKANASFRGSARSTLPAAPPHSRGRSMC